MRITLSGFGDFGEDEDTLNDLKTLTKLRGVDFYPTYYDWEMCGEDSDIEAITIEQWGMPSDQWSENALNEERL